MKKSKEMKKKSRMSPCEFWEGALGYIINAPKNFRFLEETPQKNSER